MYIAVLATNALVVAHGMLMLGWPVLEAEAHLRLTMAGAGGTIVLLLSVGIWVGIPGCRRRAHAPADSDRKQPRDRGATALRRGQQQRVERDQLFGSSRLRQRRQLSSSSCVGHGVLDGVARALGTHQR